MTTKWRDSASIVLAMALGGSTPLLVLTTTITGCNDCGFEVAAKKDEVNLVNGEANVVKVQVDSVNINAGGGEQGPDTAKAAQPAGTEYPGTPQHGCTQSGQCW